MTAYCEVHGIPLVEVNVRLFASPYTNDRPLRVPQCPACNGPHFTAFMPPKSIGSTPGGTA
jgi:hypothetical protein